MISATVLAIADIIFFYGQPIFLFLLGISAAAFFLPFVIVVLLEGGKTREKNEMFLEFSRNLAESVKTGTPISTSIVNMSKKNFGALTPNVQKLANQISIGIPLTKALETFAIEVDSETVRRAIASIRQSENAGGEIDKILDSVAESITQIEKLKKERKAAIYNLVVQGYIIFLIFVGIMIVMEFKILPLTSGIGSLQGSSGLGTDLGVGLGGGTGASPEELARPFLYLLLVQGLFAGFTIGKLSEGSIKAGIKHSFVLVVLAFLMSTGARLLF